MVVLSHESAGDDGHAEAGLEADVALGPATEFRVRVAAGVGVEEDGRVVVGGDELVVVLARAGPKRTWLSSSVC